MASPKVCKTCRNIVYPGNKFCPVCGAKVPQGLPTWAIVVITVLAVLFVIGMFNSDKPEKVEPTPRTASVAVTPRPSPTSTPTPVYTIDDTLEMSDIRVTLHDVRNSYGKSFLTPDEGRVYLVFELEVENNRDESIAISSLLSISAYADDYALDFSLHGTSADSVQSLDGEIAAGKKKRGIIAYDAPEDWQVAEIRFKPNVWSGREFIFVAPNPDA